MNLTIETYALRTALQTVRPAVAGRSTLPVLANVLLSAEANRLTITATNLEISIRTTLPCEVDMDGATTVNAKMLLEIVSSLTDPRVALSLVGRELVILNGKTRMNLPVIEAVDFPPFTVPTDEVLAIAAPWFNDTLSRVLYAASPDEARPILQGVHLYSRDDMLHVEATDGFRVVIADTGKWYEGGKLIVPASALDVVKRTITWGDMLITADDSSIAFTANNTTVLSQLIAGNFPDTHSIIPKEYKHEYIVNRQQITAALRQVMVVSDQHPISFGCTDDALTLNGQGDDGQGEVSVPCKGGGALQFAVNGKFMLDALTASKSEMVTIRVKDNASPLDVASGDGVTNIVMPMHKG